MIKLVHFITSLEQGGAQAVLYDIISGIHGPDVSHTIIYIHDGPYKKQFELLDIPLYQVGGLVSTYDPFILIRLYQLLKKLKPDYLHTMLWSANWMGRIVARLLGIQSVAVLHNRCDHQRGIRTMLDRCAPETQMIAVSQEVKDSFATQFRQIAVIQNGVNIFHIQALAHRQKKSRKALGLSVVQFVIGSVGRFHPVKRYPLLLESFALLYKERPYVRLMLIGDGQELEKLRLIAHDLGIAHAVRFIIGERAYGYYPLFDCFIQTSASEGISIALLEAMSCGIVPIVTHSEALHPVVTDKADGLLVNSSNPICIINAIKLLIDNVALRKRLSDNALQTVAERFGVDAMIASYKKFLMPRNRL